MSSFKGKQILSTNEAAEYLAVSKRKVLDFVQNKEIRHYRNSNKLIYFKIEDLDAYLLSNPVEVEKK